MDEKREGGGGKRPENIDIKGGGRGHSGSKINIDRQREVRRERKIEKIDR